VALQSLEAAIIATAMSTIDCTERCTPPLLAPLAEVETPVLSRVCANPRRVFLGWDSCGRNIFVDCWGHVDFTLFTSYNNKSGSSPTKHFKTNDSIVIQAADSAGADSVSDATTLTVGAWVGLGVVSDATTLTVGTWVGVAEQTKPNPVGNDI